MYIVSSSYDNKIIFTEYRHCNIYMIDLDDHSLKNYQCLIVMDAKVN